MPWPSERKQQSRERILDSAARLFSTRGFDSVSIGDVMTDAGLTHGGFYSHFTSKRELYAEAVTMAAARSARARLPRGDVADKAFLSEILMAYLDMDHVRGTQIPCPLAFLATDVANREEDVRAAYTEVFKRLVAVLARHLPVDTSSRRNKALALSALMVGGVAVSRALADEREAESLLEACVEMGTTVIGDTVSPRR